MDDPLLKTVANDAVRNVDSKKRDLYRQARETKATKKKAKQVKDRLFLVMQKRAERKPPSYLQKLINMVTRKNLKTTFEIKEFLASLGENVSDGTTDYIKLVGKTKVVNGKLTFSDTFANKPIYILYLIKSAATKVFTNDTLYLAGNLKTNLPVNDFFNKYNKIIQNLIVDGAHVVSQPFYAESQTKKGYIQDYEADFCAIGLEDIDEEARNSILAFKVNVKQFSYLGKNYFFSGNDQACVIAESSIANNAKKLYNAQVRFHLEKKVVSGEKTIKIKGKPRYLDFVAKPDSFCPAYMILPEPVLTYVLMKFHLDYNDLYDILYQQIEAGSIQIFSGCVYWDTYSGFFDMAEIACLLMSQSTAQRKLALEMLGSICVQYEKYKQIIAIWAKNQLAICRILDDFYNSCSTKIRHDKMVELRESLYKCIDTRNYLMMDESFTSIKKIFRDLGENAFIINNQFRDEFTKSCDFLLTVLTKIKSGDFSDLEEDVYQAGYAIYQLGLCADSDIRAIPSVFSTGAFFANVFGEKYAKVPGGTILSQVVGKFVLKEKKAEDKVIDISVAMTDVLRNLAEYKNKILENSINAYIEALKGMINKGSDNAKTRLLISINSNLQATENMNIQNQLSELIGMKMSNPKTVSDLPDSILKSNELENIVKNQIDKLNKESDISDIDNRINMLQKKKEELSDRTSSTPSASSRKTMYFKKSLSVKGKGKGKKKARSAVDYSVVEEEKEIEPFDRTAYEVKSVVGDVFDEPTVFLDDEVVDPLTNKRLPNSTINKWYLAVLDASGIYDEILQNKPLVDMIVKTEEPARLMANIPLAYKIIEDIVKNTGIPPLGAYYINPVIPEKYVKNTNIEKAAVENATRMLIDDPLDIKKLPVFDKETIQKFYTDVTNKGLRNLKSFRILNDLPLNKEIDKAFDKMSPEEKKYYEREEEKSMEGVET